MLPPLPRRHEVNSHLKLVGLSDDLKDYLRPFEYAHSAVRGNKEALTRIASEVCFDKFNDNVRYLEIRFSPQLLMGENLTCSQVVQIVLSSATKTEAYLNSDTNPTKLPEFAKALGQTWPEFKVRFILCGIWGQEQWLKEILDVIQELDPSHKYLVGIDMAGNSKSALSRPQSVRETEQLFNKAKLLNISRTFHAGEDGPAETVIWAIEKLFCTRIGHGYRLSEDPVGWSRYLVEPKETYQASSYGAAPKLSESVSCQTNVAPRGSPQQQQTGGGNFQNLNGSSSGSRSSRGPHLRRGPHFEMCPLSSIYTNVKNMREEHVLKFIRPGKFNVSISTDNSSLHFSTLSTEYDHLELEYGWTFQDLCDSNINALAAAFGDVDQAYIELFREVYMGMQHL